MAQITQQEKAQIFLSWHRRDEPLVLPNIWDPIGARILAAKSYPAVATASAAISASMGYADSEKIKRSTLINIITRIAASVDIPVTADIESGFGSSIPELQETIRQVVASGVVGINIEDSITEGGALQHIDEQCERIAAVRDTADEQGLHLVINARIDSFLSDAYKSQEEKIEEAIIRAKAYIAAGADSIYPIGPGDKETVAVLRSRITGPLNILATPDAESLPTLRQLGVNRISFGPFIFRSCMQKFADIADQLNNMGDYDSFANNMMSGAEMGEFLIHDRE